MFPYTKRA